MRLAWNNLLKTASSISATNEDANYEIENVYSKWKKQKFQADTTSSVVTIAWAADQTISCIGWAYHNMSGISAVMKNAAAATLATWAPTPTYQTDVSYQTELTTVRSIVITITSASTLYLGGLFFGTYLDVDKEPTQALPYKSTANITKSLGGQVAGRTGVILRSAPLTFPYITNTQRVAFETAYDSLQELYPFWLDLWQSSHATFQPIYGHFTSGINTSKDNNQAVTVSFDFEEAN